MHEGPRAQNRTPPGPPPAEHLIDELSRLRDLQRDVLGTFAHRFAIYGDFVYVRVRQAEMYSTCHPEIAREILLAHADSCHKRTMDLEILGDGLLTSDGEAWRRQRRRIQPGFRHESIVRYGQMISDEAERMLDGFAGQASVEVRASMMQLTLSVVCRALFGQSFTGNSRRISKAMRILQEAVLEPKLLPPWVPTPRRLRRERMTSIVNREVFAIIDNASSAPDSLLTELKALTDDEGSMSRQQLRDEIVTLFLAGHETTALALTWTLYLVSLHPDVEARIVEELDRVVGSDTPDARHLGALEYTERTIKEAMRLYPPVYVIPRVCVRPVEIAGYPVRPGAEVWCWPYFMQRDPRWFHMPDRFDPDRFLPEGEAARYPHAYLPFGTGMRTCVGRHFAMLEAVLVLACILRRYHLTPLDARPLRPLPRITLSPERPVHVALTPRR